MPRRNSYGKYIIPAGEVGAYAVCPEAWRLRSVVRVTRPEAEDAETGERLHQEWAHSMDESLFITRSRRAILMLLAASMIVYLLSKL